MPAEHGEHASEEVLPELALYVPGGQDEQSTCEVLPVLLLYVPALHSIHCDAPTVGL